MMPRGEESSSDHREEERKSNEGSRQRGGDTRDPTKEVPGGIVLNWSRRSQEESSGGRPQGTMCLGR